MQRALQLYTIKKTTTMKLKTTEKNKEQNIENK